MAGLIIAGALSAAWCAIAIRLGHSLGILDRPDQLLKTHRRPVVPLGGVGIFIGVHLALVIVGEFDAGLAVASALLLVTGLSDDIFGLRPSVRLVAASVAGLVLVWWSELPVDGVVDALLVVTLVLMSVNAVNLLDGLDGLAGSTAIASALGIAGIATLRDLSVVLGLALVGGLIGFIVFNWHPARIFMGDNGAYVVGLLLAYGVLRVSPEMRADLLVGLLVFGVFLIDLVATVFRRRSLGRPLFKGDRSHLYDQLAERGWSVPAISGLSVVVQTALASLAVGLLLLELAWWSIIPLIAVATIVLIGLDRGGWLRPSLS